VTLDDGSAVILSVAKYYSPVEKPSGTRASHQCRAGGDRTQRLDSDDDNAPIRLSLRLAARHNLMLQKATRPSAEVRMPIYEYRCAKCGKTSNGSRSFPAAPLQVHEMRRGGRTVNLDVRAAVQGSGWYVNDYAKAFKQGRRKGGESKGGESKFGRLRLRQQTGVQA